MSATLLFAAACILGPVWVLASMIREDPDPAPRTDKEAER